MGFSKEFVWGAASAAYQVEGGAYADGRGPSIWDIFSHRPGTTANGDTGDVACDSYRLFREDAAVMKKLGIAAYRFSVSWPRVLPDGTGKVNEQGLHYYDMLIDELLKNGITPYITLFHWDYPEALHMRGGWLNPDSPKWFAEYAALIAARFSDRVRHFMTINEPQVFIGNGYGNGVHAPGQKLGNAELLQMAHNVLLAHGKAVRAMREAAVRPIEIGLAATCSYHYPASSSDADIQAAREAVFSVDPHSWHWSAAWWNDPIFFGRYPKQAFEQLEQYMPHIGQDDMNIISAPIDFEGQNIYNGCAIAAGADGRPIYLPRKTGAPKTALNWPITPESLYWGPKFMYERYACPVYITENGLSDNATVSLDGAVHDACRKDFLQRYLQCLSRAADDDVDVRGYFHWSLTDNYEWHSGYAERFGMVYIDYATQERIIKDSGYWYKRIIETNGAALFDSAF